MKIYEIQYIKISENVKKYRMSSPILLIRNKLLCHQQQAGNSWGCGFFIDIHLYIYMYEYIHILPVLLENPVRHNIAARNP